MNADIINLDADTESADWTKATWDLPPFGSKEFYDQMGPDFDLEHFKTLPVYQNAVAAGLIHDDEWVADCCTEAENQPVKPKRRNGIIIHLD
jgi:hypothetical protein